MNKTTNKIKNRLDLDIKVIDDRINLSASKL